MAYCTNPDCRHRERTGSPAEYQPGTSHCADCGEPLEPGERPRPTPTPRIPWPRSLLKRLAITAGAMVVVFGAGLIPHPLLNREAFQGYGLLDTGFGPFSLGVTPLLVGFVLVELVALALPFTRQRRCSDPALRRRLWLAGALVGVTLAWVQGLSLAITLENYWNHGWGAEAVDHPGWLFRLFTACMLASGVATLAALARWLDRHGLGPGMAALLLLDAMLLAGKSLWGLGREVHIGVHAILPALLLLAALGAVLWFFHWLMGRRAPGGLPACAPCTGLLPYELALLVLLVPTTLANFTGNQPLYDLFVPGSMLWLGIALPVVVLGAPLAALLFYWRRRDWWSTAPKRAPWLQLLAMSAGALLLMILMETWLLRVSPALAFGGMTGWLGLLALGSDAWGEIGLWLRGGGAPRLVSEHQDVADALEELDELRRANPDAHYILAGLRFRSLTYFFGPYVPLRILEAPSPHLQSVEA